MTLIIDDYVLWSIACCILLFFFFFQAEDGIRDLTVTGVQTCALPIFGFRLVPLLFRIGKRRLRRIDLHHRDRVVIRRFERLHDLDLVDVRSPRLVLTGREGGLASPTFGNRSNGKKSDSESEQRALVHAPILVRILVAQAVDYS